MTSFSSIKFFWHFPPQPPAPIVYVAPVVVAPVVIPALPVVVLPPPPASLHTPNNPGFTIFEAVGFNGASSKLYGRLETQIWPPTGTIGSVRCG